MGNGQWERGRKRSFRFPCPMPDARCPMPNAPFVRIYNQAIAHNLGVVTSFFLVVYK
ncbi:MAG: hypothetical protein KME31_14850 [Tolypothrix carrinoi HA7290-LM1]|nr:hypothetical protein [Tolypothrix carrinoi HA7290-LM1]